MKILILTFSKGINPGTFMQAYGVQSGMKKIFPNAEIKFLDFDDFKSHKITKNIKVSLVTLFCQKAYAFVRLLNYKKHYNKTFKLTSNKVDIFNYEEKDVKKIIEAFDFLIIGSDTILEEAIGDGNKVGLNWGPKFLKLKKVFFAASASPANFELSKESKLLLKESVESFSFKGIRDELTINFLNNEVGVAPELINKQPDPTFLLDLAEFSLPNYYQRKLENKKIALCNFNSNFPFRKELAHMLKQKGYTLISTFYNPYVDIQVATVDAFGWAGVFPYCELVVTERFHDSVFALRNCKPIIAIDWDKERFSGNGDSKTFRILSDYQLEKYHLNIQKLDDLRRLDILLNEVGLIDPDEIMKFNVLYQDLANDYLNRIKEI